MMSRIPTKKPNPAIRSVAATVGGIPALAKRLDVSEVTVYQWANGVRPVPALRAIEMDEISKGKVSCEEINPEGASLYGYLRKRRIKAATQKPA